ncbi:GNAT family N-acetyltransferase, partial [Actinomadura adrarensis]
MPLLCTETEERTELRDGSLVTVRPIEPGDAEEIRAMHLRCSVETRRLRYFTPKRFPSPRQIARFCDPAHGVTVAA